MGENEVPTAIITNNTPLELERIICCRNNPTKELTQKELHT